MSKHIFKQTVNGREHEIQIGWDRLLQQYYGTIIAAIEVDTPEGKTYEDDVIWMNIFSPVVYSLEGIAQKIVKRGFTIPDGLLENVREDRYNDAGNTVQDYDTDTPPQQAHTLQPPSL